MWKEALIFATSTVPHTNFKVWGKYPEPLAGWILYVCALYKEGHYHSADTHTLVCVGACTLMPASLCICTCRHASTRLHTGARKHTRCGSTLTRFNYLPPEIRFMSRLLRYCLYIWNLYRQRLVHMDGAIILCDDLIFITTLKSVQIPKS